MTAKHEPEEYCPKHNETTGYHLGCMCDYCRPTTMASHQQEIDKVLKTNHPGFMRKELTVEDAGKILDEIQQIVPNHFKNYGAGIFTHPHEIVGCMTGQLYKLSAAADESIYDGELQKFRTRCVKTLMAIFVGLASVDKLIELRETTNETD